MFKKIVALLLTAMLMACSSVPSSDIGLTDKNTEIVFDVADLSIFYLEKAKGEPLTDDELISVYYLYGRAAIKAAKAYANLHPEDREMMVSSTVLYNYYAMIAWIYLLDNEAPAEVKTEIKDEMISTFTSILEQDEIDEIDYFINEYCTIKKEKINESCTNVDKDYIYGALFIDMSLFKYKLLLKHSMNLSIVNYEYDVETSMDEYLKFQLDRENLL